MKPSSIRLFTLHAFFAMLTGMWVALEYVKPGDGTFTYTYNFLYALLALYGGVCAFFTAKEWGGFKSLYGKTLIFLGITLVSWSVGGFIWAYYNFGGFTVNNFINPQTIDEAPYPSWADLGFGLYIPLALISLMTLAHAVGVKYIWKDHRGKIVLITVPVLATIVTFLMYKDLRQLQITDPGQFLQIFFNYYYTAGGAFIAALAGVIIYLSPQYQSGKLKYAIYLVAFGVTMQYVADFVFTYRTYPGIESYYNADISDFLYSLSLYAVAIGANKISIK